MKRTKHSWFIRLIAALLVVVSLVQWFPAEGLLAAVEAASAKGSYIPGDVNSDGTVNVLDVVLVRRWLSAYYTADINMLAADVDRNGVIDANDVEQIRLYAAGGYGVALQPGLENFTVSFVTNGGSSMADKSVPDGTAADAFGQPFWVNHIFRGWYYDAALTVPVKAGDKVTDDLTLYAAWEEQPPLETVETVHFASAEDVGTDFSIPVLSSDPDMTAAEVAALIEADDLADPDARDIITVSGANGVFTVAGAGGFDAGSSYRITLGSDKLTFKDQPAEARQYNFTVFRENVMNLSMQGDVIYLSVQQVSNIINNGQRVATLDLSLYESDGTNVTVADLSSGSFKYTGGTLQKGDIVCIYEGAHPVGRDENTPAAEQGDMAYVEITGRSGNTYTYTSAEAEDVIFTPDILPMPEAADTDSDAATVTVEDKYLDYSADLYAEMNLDSQTTVDVGDFFAFYTGELAVTSGPDAGVLTGYGKITAVTANGDGTTTIAFTAVTWEELEACMAVYAQQTMSGDDLLEGVDTSAMEAEIEQQAYDSGFAEEAALYLSSLALATENFTALRENVNVEDYKVTLTDGTPVSPEELQLMASGVETKINSISVKAKVGRTPTHLGSVAGTSADSKGLCVELGVKVVFTVYAPGSRGGLEITVEGSFIEELGVDFGVNVDAVWKVAFIVPYIYDIRISANVDTINYTAVSFHASMVTQGGEENDEIGDVLDMADSIKSLLEEMTKGGEANDSIQNTLVDRYAEMLSAESDWVRVLEYNIVSVKQSIPCGIPLINFQFDVNFVVEMDASISVGFEFEYIEGKRHVFTIALRGRKVSSDTIDLKEKTYGFCFYAMGRIGLRAGVEMEFSVYAISKSLGSVGFSAGAGAYTKLYGYFFYELEYTKSAGKKQAYSGALLVQVGIYLQFGLEAQALGGRYSATANILDKEWKLLEAGRRDNVLDFDMQQEDIEELVMKQFVRRLQLSDDFFKMDVRLVR